jgi:hypothetical protein
MSTEQDLRNLTGKWPSQAVCGFLAHWLLPGERVQCALAGSIGLTTAFLIATESDVLVIRDGFSLHVDHVLSTSEVVGWQIEEGWTGVNFHLNTDQGLVTIGQVKPRFGVAFGHALLAIVNGLGPQGLPASISTLGPTFDGAAELLSQALSMSGIAHEVDLAPVEVIAADLARVIVHRAGDQMTYELWLVLALLTGIVAPEIEGGRRERVERFRAGLATCNPDDSPLINAAQAPDASDWPGWPSLLLAMAELITYTAAFLPHGRMSDGRELMMQEVDRFSYLAGVIEGRNRAAIDSDGPAVRDDVVDGLERLGNLRAQGVLSDEEFRVAKARLLA